MLEKKTIKISYTFVSMKTKKADELKQSLEPWSWDLMHFSL